MSPRSAQRAQRPSVPGAGQPWIFPRLVPETASERLRRVHGMPPRPLERPPGARRWVAGFARLVAVAAVIGVPILVGCLVWRMGLPGHAAATAAPHAVAPLPASTNPLRMDRPTTGNLAVDGALSGFLSGDVEASVARLVVHQVQCGTLPWENSPLLTCLQGEAPGTMHEMVLAGCEPGWITVEAARSQLGTLLADRPGLLSVSRAQVGYQAVLSWPGAPDRSLILAISSTGVSSYAADCGPPHQPGAGDALALAASPG